MQNQKNKNSLIISFIIIIIVALGLYLVFKSGPKKNMLQPNPVSGLSAPAGLQITVLKEGGGKAAKAGDTVSVNYTGTLSNGKVFDSNLDPQFKHVTPFIFNLGKGMVILGWDQGVAGMKIGEKRKLIISPDLAYGDQGIPGAIPPKATLIFEVELLAIK